MFKKIICACSIFVVALFACIASLASTGRISEEEAMEIAFALVEDQTGYSRDQMKENQILDGDDIWYVTIVLRNPPEDEDGLYYVEMDYTGKLISLTGPSGLNLESQLERDVQGCFDRADCYLLLADTTAKWTKKIAELSDPEISDLWTWTRYCKVINLGIAVPPDNVLSYPEACQTALKRLAELEGWTDDMAELFNIWISAYYIMDDIPVWFFDLKAHSYTEKEYESDDAMNLYRKELDNAFSKVGQTAPAEIGVLINAVTGDLIENPMLDYVPVRFFPMDFLIRTDEAVESITKNNNKDTDS